MDPQAMLVTLPQHEAPHRPFANLQHLHSQCDPHKSRSYLAPQMSALSAHLGNLSLRKAFFTSRLLCALSVHDADQALQQSF